MNLKFVYNLILNEDKITILHLKLMSIKFKNCIQINIYDIKNY